MQYNVYDNLGKTVLTLEPTPDSKSVYVWVGGYKFELPKKNAKALSKALNELLKKPIREIMV